MTEKDYKHMMSKAKKNLKEEEEEMGKGKQENEWEEEMGMQERNAELLLHGAVEKTLCSASSSCQEAF